MFVGEQFLAVGTCVVICDIDIDKWFFLCPVTLQLGNEGLPHLCSSKGVGNTAIEQGVFLISERTRFDAKNAKSIGKMGQKWA
jgi:hypothetical protein